MCEVTYTRHLDSAHSQGCKADRWLPLAGGGEEQGVIFPGHGVSIWEGEKVLEMGDGDGCTTQ